MAISRGIARGGDLSWNFSSYLTLDALTGRADVKRKLNLHRFLRQTLVTDAVFVRWGIEVTVYQFTSIYRGFEAPI